MNDEQIFLANAYLDGELTAAERRIAEADPEVMSEVEQLGALQAELRDVTPPSSAAREAAITAAMSEFGTNAPATARPAAVTAPVVPFRPRPAYAKLLAVAAAVVAVAGLGIVVAQNGLGGGGDDDSIASDEPVAELAARESAEATAESTTEEADEAVGGAVADDGSNATLAASDAGDESAQAEVAADMADEDTAEIAEDPESASPPSRVSVPPDFDPDAPITDPIELGIYGSYLLDQRDRNSLGPTPNTACVSDHEILGTATFLRGDDEIPVFVGVQEIEGVVVAVNSETCVEVLTGSLF